MVLCLHLLLLAGAWRLGAWDDRSPPTRVQAPLWLRWPEVPADKPAQPAQRPTRPQSHPSAGRPSERAAAPRPQSAPEAITLPEQAPSAAAASAPPAAADTDTTATPLNLRLPQGPNGRWAQPPANPALGPDRLRAAPPTLESRIALATGPGQWVEERIDENRVRLRRGGICIELQRSEIGRWVDPWNQSFSPKPGAGMPCR